MITTNRLLVSLAAVVVRAGALHAQGVAPNPPRSLDGQPAPVYPVLLARAGVEGEVSLRVSVDSLGHAIPAELRTLRSSHDLFGRAARAAVLAWHFEPGVGPTDVVITFSVIDVRGRCDSAFSAAGDPALMPYWYHYDRATGSARIDTCGIPTTRSSRIP